ncbi:MAG: glycosyltransferase [Gillisia sp.]
MTLFKHIIITRFNLPKRWNTDKNGHTILDASWLEDRFELFENFCLPSIIGQTIKNFEWWIYFDQGIEVRYKDLIQNIEAQHSFIKAKYEKSYDDFLINLPIDLHKYSLKGNIDWLITTRLDNDDMLAKDTIAILQKNNNFQKNNLLEIPCGYNLELNRKPKPKLRKLEMELNPFISYVEKVEKEKRIKGVYFYDHTEWKGVDRIIVTKRPQWVQVIHDKNVINRLNGDLVSPLNFQSRFIFNYKVLDLKISYKFYAAQILKFFKIEHLDRE